MSLFRHKTTVVPPQNAMKWAICSFIYIILRPKTRDPFPEILILNNMAYDKNYHYFSVLQDTIRKRWEQDAVCDYRSKTFSYGELATEIAAMKEFFDAVEGLEKGKHIAICARNTARWAVSFLSVCTAERVIVPILADFLPENINTLTHHSDSVVLFTNAEIWKQLDIEKMPLLKAVISTDDFSLLYSANEKVKEAYEGRYDALKAKYPNGYGKEDVNFPVDNQDDLSIINYTSGTTSAPKGVMLTYGNINASIEFALRRLPIREGDKIVSMLPMAHIYGMAFEFIYPLTGGCPVVFLGKSPAPSLLLKAMQDVRPYAVITVPLVMEKIYASSLKPVLSKPVMKVLTAIPCINSVIFKKIREKLMTAFGGKVRYFIMGGAALNPEVERWFRRIKLPYCVGYGMTEAAPLIAYEDPWYYAQGSCGRAVDCADVRVDSKDPEHVAGELLARGANICKGYYKNEEATSHLYTEDGYLHTGDLGVIDKHGNIFIRGRSKNMILSANGQNIYPEELEAVVNNQSYVQESVVVDRNTRLVALVYLNADAIKKDGLTEEAVAELPKKIAEGANRRLPAYSRIKEVELVNEPFEKTPKMSIKRFMYK